MERKKLLSSSVPVFASTGTEGRRRVAVGGNLPPDRGIPLDVAFRRAVESVNAGLDAEGVVWGDVARARVVRCILEVAAENGWLAPWEGDAA